MPENSTGLVKGLIIGVGGLVVLTVLVFIVVSTILNANLLRATASQANSTENNINVNNTGFTLVGYSALNRDYSILMVKNATGNVIVPLANFSLSSTGVLKNATLAVYEGVGVNVTYGYYTPTEYERAASGFGGNLTTGVINVSLKIPTILLIAAVVLLFAIIALLVRQSRNMGIGEISGGKGARQKEGSL